MSFSSGFASGVAAGGQIRDRWDDKKKRAEDIRLKLEQEERQMQFERERRAQQLKDEMVKMGYGGELDLKKLAAQIEGQGSLATADRAWRSGEASTDRAWRSGEAGADRTFRGSESAADRKARADQVKRQLDLQEQFGNADIGFKVAETGARLLDAKTRAEKADLVQVKEIVDGAEIMRMVPPDQVPGYVPPQTPGAPQNQGRGTMPSKLTGSDLLAYQAAMAAPDRPESKRALQLLRSRGLIE